jgi:hypothetical protein
VLHSMLALVRGQPACRVRFSVARHPRIRARAARPVETVDAHPRHSACRAPFGARYTALPAHTAITRHMGLPWLAGLEAAYSGLARLPGETPAVGVWFVGSESWSGLASAHA